ncbi:SEC-C metal-binding domain-containing protein [Metasolibacillus sp.]|uniref:SEC-C metal-binding domain-containing protein n=1 Tax=Metasolibacillus sp. TaxID=2703680 RepID=UPI0025EA1C77|nr:SEC-C metal-binding domain-containing protein [Metasolibacillus sp.]MCT6922740.1 SEC-C metal-binding domain-containing protein [Metasolibacillus sp.]MCT6938921.1 SEC-C metal-binding domain-containing protein [Metasolibacillus sp.]
MIGRNDPCLCGSGKKYKKCCEGKAQITSASLFNEEIETILQSFYEAYPQRKDIGQYIELVQAWSPKLQAHLQKELIEAVALDEFFFHVRPDIWTGYLKKVSKKTVRPATARLLEKWTSPAMFIGAISHIDEQYIHATHAITKENVKIRRENNKPIPEEMQIFTFLLPDGSEQEDHFLAVSTLIFFSSEYAKVFQKFAADYPSVEKATENHLAFWQLLVENGYAGEEFTSFEADVLTQVKQFLQQHALNEEQLIPIVEDYLIEQQPAARKAAAIAAGAIRFGQERSLFEASFTVKEIAEHFGISAASLNKYYQDMLAYQLATA